MRVTQWLLHALYSPFIAFIILTQFSLIFHSVIVHLDEELNIGLQSRNLVHCWSCRYDEVQIPATQTLYIVHLLYWGVWLVSDKNIRFKQPDHLAMWSESESRLSFEYLNKPDTVSASVIMVYVPQPADVYAEASWRQPDSLETTPL